MIEVEKKFAVTPEQIKTIENAAEFVGETKNIDVYYDTSDYKLTRQDKWFRNRDGRFEIKVPIKKGIRLVNVYHEITDLEKISEHIGLKKLSEDFEENLKLNHFEILLKVTTKRRKFKIRDFNIDVDEADYGYIICEIEKMVEDEGEAEKATEEIFELAKQLGLEIKWVRGKGLEYFYRYKPEVYKIIEDLRLRYE